MKAIILAAGMGKRMHPLTLNCPKCLLSLNGKTIIEHQISLLEDYNINKIEIITGYENKKIEDNVKNKVQYFYYPDYNSTNNLYTLYHHLDLLNDDLFIFFSDVLISRLSFENCINSKADFSLLVDTDKCDESTMRILVENNNISDIGSHITPDNGDGNFIGIAKFSKAGAELLKDKINVLVKTGKYINDYYTIAIAQLAKENHCITPIRVNGLPWMEIDTYDEYKKAQKEKFYVL